MNKIFWIFVGLIVLAPLPFGLVFELTQAFFACAVLSLVLAYCVLLLKEKNPPAVSVKSIWPETMGFFLVLGWGIVQLTSFTPESLHHPLWAEAGGFLGLELSGSISLARGSGFEAIMRLITYGAVFYLALQLGRDRKRAEHLLWAIILACTRHGQMAPRSVFSSGPR